MNRSAATLTAATLTAVTVVAGASTASAAPKPPKHTTATVDSTWTGTSTKLPTFGYVDTPRYLPVLPTDGI